MATPTFSRAIPLVPAGDDLAPSLAFYQEALGFSLLWSAAGYAALRRDQTEILLQQFGDESFRNNFVFRIQTTEIDALHARIRELNVPRLGPLETKSWGTYEFHVLDPAGVLVQFFR